MIIFRATTAATAIAAAGLLFSTFSTPGEFRSDVVLAANSTHAAAQRMEAPAMSAAGRASPDAAPLFAFTSPGDTDRASAAADSLDAEAAKWTVPARAAVQPVASNSALSTKGDGATSARLAADIQRNLRRMACYEGPLHGEWDSATRSAMARAVTLHNARLSVKAADVALLALAQGAADGLCKAKCQDGGTDVSGCTIARTAAIRSDGAPSNTSARHEPPPGMMTVGGPRADSIELPGQSGVSASIAGAQKGPAVTAITGVSPGAAAQRPRAPMAIRKAATHRDADRYFTHPLSRNAN